MQVLQYALPSSTQEEEAAEQGASDFLLQVLDNALPQQLLLHLQQVFAPAAPFWREHSYGRVGYFSYFFRLVSCFWMDSQTSRNWVWFGSSPTTV
jgi:hypothetical protein